MENVHVKRHKEAKAAELRQKALEPQKRRCYILNKDVTVLVEYPDYRDARRKGAEGAIYCENIIECYHNNVECRYSGISPLYPDPFVPRDEVIPEEES